MVTAMVDSTWPVMSAIKWSRQYHGMLASPLTSTDLLHGQVLWITFRTLNTAVAMGLVLAIPADTRSVGLIGSVLAGVLTGLAFQYHRIYALQVQQVRQHQPGRTGADDGDLGAHQNG